MRRFLKKISFFLIVIFIVWILIECFYRFTPNNYTEKHNRIQNNYTTAEILIFGNSHPFYGLNPKYFDQPAYNIANISQTIYFDKLLFDKHIGNFEKLEYVVLNIEYTSLSQKNNTSEDVWRKYFYQAQMDLDVPFIPFYDLSQYSLASNRSLKNSWRTIKTYFKNKTLVECDENGWGTTYLAENNHQNLEELSKIITKKHEDNSMDFDKNINGITSMIKKCKDLDIKVLLVTMPVHQSYSEKINNEKAQAIFEVAEKLAYENSNTSYLNLFYNKTFSDEDFFDPDHLNDKGAQKCSKMVNFFIK